MSLICPFKNWRILLSISDNFFIVNLTHFSTQDERAESSLLVSSLRLLGSDENERQWYLSGHIFCDWNAFTNDSRFALSNTKGVFQLPKNNDINRYGVKRIDLVQTTVFQLTAWSNPRHFFQPLEFFSWSNQWTRDPVRSDVIGGLLKTVFQMT